jgi:hypothetical protein
MAEASIERSQQVLTTRAAFQRRVFPGKTLRVVARGEALLRACDGELWVTWEARPDATQPDCEDHFVPAGQCVFLCDGEVVVVGASDPRHGLAAFDVEPLPAPKTAPVPAPMVAPVARPGLLAGVWRRGWATGGLLAA